MKKHELTPDQKECVEYERERLMVRGVAGTGKTTVLLHRAEALAKRPGAPEVRIFTFNRALTAYARGLVDDLRPEAINTFHSWAAEIIRRRTAQSLTVIYGRRRERLIETVLARVKTEVARALEPGKTPDRVLDLGMPFWSTEITWIKGRMIEDLATYEQVSRSGRVNPIQIPSRRVVWKVYQAYNAELERLGAVDYDDFARILLAWWPGRESVPAEERIDYVLIDEAQDFQLSMLELLGRVWTQSITVVADAGQRIHGNSFSWSAVGFDFQGGGRVKVLWDIFRPTRQIVELAEALRTKDDSNDELGMPPLTSKHRLREGSQDLPQLYQVWASSQGSLEEEVEQLVTLLEEMAPEATRQNETIGVLARHTATLMTVVKRFRSKGAPMPWKLIREKADNPVSPGIKLVTFHSSKGLEFDRVVLLGLDAGLVPQPSTWDMTDQERELHLTLERRVLYVAMTRAKDALYMVRSEPGSSFLNLLDSEKYEHVVCAPA